MTMTTTRNFIIITLISILFSLGVGYNVGIHRCRSQPSTSVAQRVSLVPSEPMVTVRECEAGMAKLGDECAGHIKDVQSTCTAKIREAQKAMASNEWDTYDDNTYRSRWYPLEDRTPCYQGKAIGNANCDPYPYNGTTLGTPHRHRRYNGGR